MPADGGLMVNNQANKLSCEVFVGNIPPETQAPTLQVRRTSYIRAACTILDHISSGFIIIVLM